MASAGSPSSTVELTVRCAFQTSKDIKVVCPLHWTIRLLKEHLHQVCPSRPAVISQRLIFSGACLTDDMVIKDVIDQRKVVEGPQVLHLVCPLPQSSLPELRQRQIPTTVTNSNPSSVTATRVQPSVGSASLSLANYYEWYQHYYGATTPEHLERLQQYSRFYAAYMEQWYGYQNYMLSQMGYVASLSHQAGTVANNEQPMVMPIARVLAARDDHGRVAMPPNQADANIARVAQQIPAEPNVAAVPGGERDVLDFVYRVFRVLLFVSAVLLYSSVERFLAVITIALFIFFIQLRRNQQRQANATEPVERNVNNNNAGENSQEVAEQVQPAYVVPTLPSGLQIFLATCYSFITSFFTSLIPDHPVPVDLN